MNSARNADISVGRIRPNADMLVKLLENFLPDVSYAIYHNSDGELRLLGGKETDWRFPAHIDATKLAAINLPYDADSGNNIRVLSSDESSFLGSSKQGSNSGSIGLRLLTRSQTLLGVLAVQGDDELWGLLNSEEFTGIVNLLQDRLVHDFEYSRLETRHSFVSKLVRQNVDLDITSPTSEWFRLIVETLGRVLSFDEITISLSDGSIPDNLKVAFNEGRDPKVNIGHEFSSKDTWHWAVYDASEPLTGNLGERYRGRIDVGDLVGSKLCSILGVPLVESGESKGSLVLESETPNAYSEDDVHLVEVVAQIFGTALVWSNMYQEEHASATVDGLTQLLNHRSFMRRLEEELERCTRYGDQLTFLMLDIDQFKSVNDNYGHLHGDYVLTEISRLIKSSIRLADTAGRLGGEEFGVIIINANKKDSRSTAERIKSSIASYKFASDEAESRSTVSIGMSEYPKDGNDMRQILRRADQAMYYKKNQGGNGVQSYSPQIEKK